MNWHVPSRNDATEWCVLFFGLFFSELNCWILMTPHVKRMMCKLKSQMKMAKNSLWNEACRFYVYLQHLSQRSIFSAVFLKKNRNHLTLMHYLPRIAFCWFWFHFFRVWNVRYNHSHDQLILTGSSDSRVILSNMVSISSEPFGHMVDDDELSDQEDQHQEDKYEVSWVLCRCLIVCLYTVMVNMLFFLLTRIFVYRPFR